MDIHRAAAISKHSSDKRVAKPHASPRLQQQSGHLVRGLPRRVSELYRPNPGDVVPDKLSRDELWMLE